MDRTCFRVIGTVSVNHPQCISNHFSSELLRLRTQEQADVATPAVPTSRSMQRGRPTRRSGRPRRPQHGRSHLVAHSVTLIVLTAFYFVSDGVLTGPVITKCTRSLNTSNVLVNTITKSVDFVSLFYHPVTNGLSSGADGHALITINAILCFTTKLLCCFTGSPVVLVVTHIVGNINFTYYSIYLTA